MEALLRQSQFVCPFLKKTSPATLRLLSTSTAHNASPGGGRMSNLQVLGRRCPVMGKALTLQSAKIGNNGMSGIHRGARASHSKTGKAGIHTSGTKPAQAVDNEILRRQPGSLFALHFHHSLCTSTRYGASHRRLTRCFIRSLPASF